MDGRTRSSLEDSLGTERGVWVLICEEQEFVGICTNDLKLVRETKGSANTVVHRVEGLEESLMWMH